jgi:hypothetical protein
MRLSLKRALALLCALLLAFGLTACAKSASTSGYKGEAKEVAQTISNFESDVTAGEEKKICSGDLASTLVTSLDRTSGGCQQAVKNQIAEVDNFEVTIESIQISGTTATAQVLSVQSGKKRPVTLTLTKQSGKWKISGLG